MGHGAPRLGDSPHDRDGTVLDGATGMGDSLYAERIAFPTLSSLTCTIRTDMSLALVTLCVRVPCTD